MKDVKPDTPPQNTPLAAVFFCGSIGPLRSQVCATKAMPMKPTIRRMASSDTRAASNQPIAHADHRARQQHFQIPGVPVVPVPPDGDDVLADQDRQDERGRFERMQIDRRQSGVASRPTPAKPPLDRPSASTAGTASR